MIHLGLFCMAVAILFGAMCYRVGYRRGIGRRADAILLDQATVDALAARVREAQRKARA